MSDNVTLNQDQNQAIHILGTWYNDKSEGNEIAVLKGFAGTGKTFLTQYFVKKMNIKNPLVSAPTNKAKNVIEEMTGYQGKTVHSILGLRPDLDLAKFNPLNPIFSIKAPPNITSKLIIIDEASMVNTKLYEHLAEIARNEKVKMLFMGDPYQLPPIKENISKVFTDSPYKAELNTIVRQNFTNPSSFLIEKAIDDIKYGTDELDSFLASASQDINPSELSTSEGFVYTKNSQYSFGEYVNADGSNFLDGKSKYLAFNNANIEETLKRLRSGVFKLTDKITTSDSLVGYRTVQIGSGKNAINSIVNSEEYRIINIVDCTISDGLKGYQVLLENLYSKSARYVNIVDSTDSDNYQNYSRIVNELISKAKAFGKANWGKYYNFVNNNLSLMPVYAPNGDKVKDKDLDFSYGFTVHKSQGSTYTNSFINFANINKHFVKDEVRRLKYVAISRATNVNIIM